MPPAEVRAWKAQVGSTGVLPGSYEGENARAHIPDLRAGVLGLPLRGVTTWWFFKS